MNPITGLQKQDYRGVIFSATVVNNADDPLQRGQVQVRIPRLFDGVPDNDLPWAAPHRFSNLVYIPDVGSKVYVELLEGNPYHPTYYADVKGIGIDSIFAGSEYPNAWGMSDGNNYVKLNKTTNTIQVHSASGTDIAIASNGSMTITGANALTVNTQQDVTVNTQTSATVTAQQNVSVTATSGNITATATAGVVTIMGSQILLN